MNDFVTRPVLGSKVSFRDGVWYVPQTYDEVGQPIQLTEFEVDLVQSVVRTVIPCFFQKSLTSDLLAALKIGLMAECQDRHARDAHFPEDWRWHVEIVHWPNVGGIELPTGQVLAYPTHIAGYEIDTRCWHI